MRSLLFMFTLSFSLFPIPVFACSDIYEDFVLGINNVPGQAVDIDPYCSSGACVSSQTAYGCMVACAPGTTELIEGECNSALEGNFYNAECGSYTTTRTHTFNGVTTITITECSGCIYHDFYTGEYLTSDFSCSPTEKVEVRTGPARIR